MDLTLNRREFLGVSAATALGALAGPHAGAAEFRTKLSKALIGGIPDEKTLAGLKEGGFDGMECTAWNAPVEQAEKARELAASMDMKIHSVLRGWCNFNSTDANAVNGDIASVETALRTCKALGSDALLLVPCRVGGEVPAPWDYAYEFDPESCLVTKVVAGDNAPFAGHIADQNRATETSREAVRRLIPIAEETGVVIALENVWNNLWVKPEFFAAFVASFKSPWVKAYLDLGNHVKYAPTVEWVKALGPNLAKCHVKDFKLNPDGKGGNWAQIRDGSVDWPGVRRELEAANYNGWLTIEGGNLPMAELSERLDRIIAGV